MNSDLSDYEQHSGYPLSAKQIYALVELWNRYTVDLGDKPHTIQYRYLSGFIRDFAYHPELVFELPHEHPEKGIRIILDSLYTTHMRKSTTPPKETHTNVAIPFITLLNGLYEYAFKSCGYSEMEFSMLHSSFIGVLEEAKNMNNEKKSSFGFKLGFGKKKPLLPEVDTRNQSLVMHPSQKVPLDAVMNWWELSGGRKEPPWKKMGMTKDDMQSLIERQFGSKQEDFVMINFVQYWLLHNKLFIIPHADSSPTKAKASPAKAASPKAAAAPHSPAAAAPHSPAAAAPHSPAAAAPHSPAAAAASQSPARPVSPVAVVGSPITVDPDELESL